MQSDIVTLAHGAGGLLMQKLLKEYVVRNLEKICVQPDVEVSLADMDDSGIVDGIVFTTDTYTVSPIFFPGGDIGRLAVAGTVNDIAVMGAKPVALSLGLVLEEGLQLEVLERIMGSIAATSAEAGVTILTGDTKVVERGGVKQLIINTSGIGKASEWLEHNILEVQRYREFNGKWLVDSALRDGDKILISGSIGDHGISILAAREGYGFGTDLKSDVSPQNHLITECLKEGGVVVMKDPTRGGIANTLNEWSEKSNVGICISEADLPIKESVQAASEMLGIDPLTIGNEGKIVFGVVKEKADAILEILKKADADAAIIGEATKKVKGVVMQTVLGGKRIIDPPLGDPVPRIC